MSILFDPIFVKTSPKGFSASKCDVRNWIFSKFREIVWNFFGLLREFFSKNFLGGVFGKDIFGRNFWEDFFGRNFGVRNFLGVIFWELFFGRNFLGGIF